MELENQALKASEAVHGGEGRRLEPGVEAATWAGHEDNVVEGPEAEQASEASPGSEAAEEAQEDKHGLSLSTDMLSDLAPTCSWKVLAERWSTRNGPV